MKNKPLTPTAPSDDVSGFVDNEGEDGTFVQQEVSSFSDMTELPSRGFNRLVKARRYGRMWMLKGLKEEYRGQSVYEALLRKEFDISVKLQHPNIASVSSYEQVEGVGPCIVMEWVDGVTLSEWLAQGGISRTRRRRVFGQVLDAVAYAHSHQVVHRDLKPANILITRNGENVKLIDFGLSDADSYLVLKQPAGTQGYTSPEQARTAVPDLRNDIFSLGCVLCDLRLGLWARPVVAHCRRRAERRYASVERLRQALRQAHSLYYSLMSMAVVCAVALAVLMLTWLVNYEKADAPIAQLPDTMLVAGEEKPDSVATPPSTATPLPVSSTAAMAKASADVPALIEKGEASAKVPVEALIAKGKDLADKRIAAYGMEARIDTLTHTRYVEGLLNDIVATMKAFAHQYATDCAAHGALSTEDAQNARIEIENLLLLYFNDQYFFRWAKRLERIAR